MDFKFRVAELEKKKPTLLVLANFDEGRYFRGAFCRTEPSVSLPAVVFGSGLVPEVNPAICRTLCDLF